MLQSVSPLSAEVVTAIDDLELAARLVVEGLRSGAHRSPLHGYTAEFSQHRSYRPGDDLKYLDWKILGRTDRLYTRQFRETTSMAVMLVVDASASMAFGAPVTKFRYASVVAAALAHLIATQGDSVGLMAMSGGALSYLPARSGRPHLRALLARLRRLQPEGAWAPARAIARGAELLKRRGVVVVLSDFYDAEDETRRELRRAARRGHDVAMLQVISRAELTFPYRGEMEIEDVESGRRQLLDAGAAAAAYRAAVAAFVERCRRDAGRDGLDYALLPTDVPPDRALRTYLVARAARAETAAR
jgi:uncharacterized protein (DUF58 family)